MKKYLIYRAPKQADRDLNQHELVGVEYGETIHAAADAIIRAVKDDLSGNPDYSGCDVYAYAPEPVRADERPQRYQYVVTGVVSPVSAKENILVEYGVMEQGKI